MTRLIATMPATPVWTSLEAAMRQTLRSLTAAADTSALDGEQDRIRQSSRHWLVG